MYIETMQFRWKLCTFCYFAIKKWTSSYGILCVTMQSQLGKVIELFAFCESRARYYIYSQINGLLFYERRSSEKCNFTPRVSLEKVIRKVHPTIRIMAKRKHSFFIEKNSLFVQAIKDKKNTTISIPSYLLFRANLSSIKRKLTHQNRAAIEKMYCLFYSLQMFGYSSW